MCSHEIKDPPAPVSSISPAPDALVRARLLSIPNPLQDALPLFRHRRLNQIDIYLFHHHEPSLYTQHCSLPRPSLFSTASTSMSPSGTRQRHRFHVRITFLRFHNGILSLFLPHRALFLIIFHFITHAILNQSLDPHHTLSNQTIPFLLALPFPLFVAVRAVRSALSSLWC